MERERPSTLAPGHVAIRAERSGFTKHWLTFSDEGDRPDFLDRLAREAAGTEMLSQMVLGGNGGLERLRRGGDFQWPLTWLSGDASTRPDPAGSQAVAVSGIPVRTLRMGDRIAGRMYEDEDAVYCHLGAILPSDLRASRSAQARSFFENMEAVLAQADMEFHHVVRTWLYLSRLLEWYDDFNVVRTLFFKERGIFERMVPASTGIGASNPSRSAIIGDAIAVKPKTDRVRVFPVASPLQCPALDYKSSFSRAVEVVFPDGRELYVSGTASIAPDGRTAHGGDPVAQIELTLKVVRALLESRGMDWADVTQGIAYVKAMAYLEPYHTLCTEKGLASLPVTCLHADVCRDDLLFEIEVEAFQASGVQAGTGAEG